MIEHEFQGGKPETKMDWTEQYQIERQIQEGIDAAQEGDGIIGHRTARLIALQLAQPGSALETFAATGEVRFDHEDDTSMALPSVFGDLLAIVDSRHGKAPWMDVMANYVLSREENPGPLRGWHHTTADPEAEKLATQAPRLYVVSSDDLKDGMHHGAWIDAEQQSEEIQVCINRLLDSSPNPEAVAWEIYDYKSFGGIEVFGLVDQNEPEATLDTISRLARGLAEHGPAFAVYVRHFGTSAGTCDQFEMRYHGRWQTVEDFARHVADDLGWYEHVMVLPEWLRELVTLDYRMLARQLAQTVEFVDGPARMVYVFGPG